MCPRNCKNMHTTAVPMWAACIIGTSLAPSPIDNTNLFKLFFAKFTTSALFLGVIRQHTAAAQFDRISVKYIELMALSMADP